MKKILKHLKKHHRLYLIIAITILFFSLSYFCFQNSFTRILESIQDLIISIIYYFCKLFKIPLNIIPSVVNIPIRGGDIGGGVVDNPIVIIPPSSNLFAVKMSAFWKTLVNIETLLRYLNIIFNFLNIACRYLLIIAPLILFVYWQYRKYFKGNNNLLNQDSKPLKGFKAFELKIYKPIKEWLISFKDYILKHKKTVRLWIVLFMFYFNIFTIILEFIAFYLYFVMSFDVLNIYIQFYKLFLDLNTMFRFVPIFIWVYVTVKILIIIRKKLGRKRQQHNEKRDCGFINSLGVSSMICGPMGKKKTTLMTDIALSQEVMFWNESFKKILENDLKFPNFPFIIFEKIVQKEMYDYKVYNLASGRKYIDKCEKEFYDNPCKANCFDYDYEKYGYTYFDGLKIITIFDMLRIYIQLYFIYIIQTSLLIANYKIRTDSMLIDLGHFPLRNNDFFNKDNRLMEAYSRHSHILDFNLLRLGKKMIENNEKSVVFEFGIVVITEGGKERGNQIDHKNLKKESEECNQLNDLFNLWVKVCRHCATVDNYPFIKIFFDEQRPESMGADIREVCDKIIHIEENEDPRSTLFLFKAEEIIHDYLYGRFDKTYYKYRFVRSDNTLFMYSLKNIFAKFHQYYSRQFNEFSFVRMLLKSEKGTMNSEYEYNKYYLQFKKIYSDRFVTDPFKEIFSSDDEDCQFILADIPVFKGRIATIEELKSMKSHFFNMILKIYNERKEEKKYE